MLSRAFNRLLCFGTLGAAALVLSVTTVSAEQIRLSDGRIIQGEVVGQVTEQGFTFKLTRTGGEAFFRWSQINKEDEARLRNIKDPDADLVLVVYVEGDRLNRENGDPIEGKVETAADHYLVKNLRYPAGLRVPLDEVVEGPDAVQRKVQIDARVVMKPEAVLALQEAELPAEKTAQDWYSLARLAEHLGLFKQSQDLLQRCLDQGPTSKLLAVAETMKGRIDELIKQAVVLQLMDAVRGLADKNQYAHALFELDAALKGERGGTKPSGAIKDALDNLRAEVDAAYTKWVLKEWHDEAYQAIRKYVRENKEATVNEAMNFARRTAEAELLKSMMTKARGGLDPKALADNVIQRQIKTKFEERLASEEVSKKLRERTADFTKDGWYQAVGGNLPNGGRTRQAQQPQQPGPGNQQPRFPGGNQPPRGGNQPPRGGSDFAMGDESFQDRPPAPPAPPSGGKKEEEKKEGEKGPGGIGDVDADSIAEIARRIAEAAARAREGGAQQPQQEGGPRGPSARYKDDDPRWTEIPDVVPSMQDWWAKQGDARKIKWMVAVYARDGRTMDIVRENYYRFTYR